MLEGGFKPEEYSVEKDRKYWIDKIERINNIERIKLIIEKLGITITDPLDDLKTAREVLQSFIRHFNKPELERLQAIVRQIEEEDEEL